MEYFVNAYEEVFSFESKGLNHTHIDRVSGGSFVASLTTQKLSSDNHGTDHPFSVIVGERSVFMEKSGDKVSLLIGNANLNGFGIFALVISPDNGSNLFGIFCVGYPPFFFIKRFAYSRI